MIDRLREPFNSLSHGMGACLALVGFGVLLYLADGAVEYVGASLFGVSLLFLYTCSALFHGLDVSRRARRVLRNLDRVGIYVLIAGTASPVALVALRDWNGWTMLGLLWLFAVLGIVLTLLDPFESRWVPTLLYLVMGWIPLAFVQQLVAALSPAALAWGLLGGVLYTTGVIFYLSDWPRLLPGRFEGHELWHLFALMGSGSHYVLVAAYTL